MGVKTSELVKSERGKTLNGTQNATNSATWQWSRNKCSRTAEVNAFQPTVVAGAAQNAQIELCTQHYERRVDEIICSEDQSSDSNKDAIIKQNTKLSYLWQLQWCRVNVSHLACLINIRMWIQWPLIFVLVLIYRSHSLLLTTTYYYYRFMAIIQNKLY